ncbi:MAG: mechanosensitive ion channel family protein, partial [Desulfobacterales bacterium]|nr:mechanosensitive ion channel family protein [Desulfobacterales bacterium]
IDIPLPDALNNMLGRFGGSFLLWVVAALLSWFLLKIVMARITKKTVTDLDDKVLGVVQTPLILLIVLYGVVDSLVYLELTPARISQIKTVYDFGLMLITMWTAFRLFRIGLEFIAERWVKKKEFHIKFVLIPLIEKLGKAVFFTVLLILILGFFGVDLTAFVAGAGIIGLVVAFAAQDTLANFFAGIFLIMEPKFKVNDTIKFENEVYIVRTIGLRTTQLYDIYQNMDVIVPNHTLATSKLVNLDEPDKKLRITLHIPVAFATDIDQLEEVIRKVSKDHPDIITDTPANEPLLYFNEFGPYYLDFVFMFWIENLEDRFFIRQRVFKSLYQGLKDKKIEVPLPQTVYSMHDGKLHDHPFVESDDVQSKLDSYKEGDPVLNRKNNAPYKMKLEKKRK